ncbi:putative RNA polymerase ECF-subfamily sigma factor [Serinicoccus hydrothermalis]|uniref:Putative RNA polymerase ECF-subfamily sigma factor n=1 Tax=Serinicoccus hydrothermalis TaxID=1758689 RepID=A0A1B1NBF7_9MICO|nr:SigE family RNA polymerase sigma factor [Serinicoccus hydrothermalis]ANS78753.1 putative RNA polymerase ECF-subfamily sigma factor [Serinicoccus hydrothermalis]
MHSSEEAAYVEFVDAGRATLHAYAWLLTADAHAAEDLLQETFVRVYVKWRRVASGQPLAYARRVMSNLHTDRWRKTRRETLTDEVPDRAYGADDPEVVDLVRALQQLSPRERECVVLRHYLDQSEKETAATLGVSVGAVKSYTSKGLAALRPLMQEERHV